MTTRIALSALVAALIVPSALAQADNPRLVALVGTNDAFVISLRDASGNLVDRLEPRTYDIAVSDRSEVHNFHLKGPGIDNATPVEATQEVTWTVTFGEGRYGFVCDAHATTMRGYFTVGTLPTAKLSGSVGPGRKISLSPRSAEVGPAAITVNDRSRTDNFHLTGPGVNRKTRVATRGRVTWNVTLRPGRYAYRSDKSTKLRGAFTVRFPG
jgi:hypothetical protein